MKRVVLFFSSFLLTIFLFVTNASAEDFIVINKTGCLVKCDVIYKDLESSANINLEPGQKRHIRHGDPNLYSPIAYPYPWIKLKASLYCGDRKTRTIGPVYPGKPFTIYKSDFY